MKSRVVASKAQRPNNKLAPSASGHRLPPELNAQIHHRDACDHARMCVEHVKHLDRMGTRIPLILDAADAACEALNDVFAATVFGDAAGFMETITALDALVNARRAELEGRPSAAVVQLRPSTPANAVSK